VRLAAISGWTRLVVTEECPSAYETLARLTVEEGTVYLDDVQIEAGTRASEFNVRPEEWVRLEIGEGGWSELPKWVEGDAVPRTVVVFNDSRTPVKGKVSVFVGPWNKPADRKIGEFDASEIPPGGSKVLAFATEKLGPNAYVVVARVEEGGKVMVDGEKAFNPSEPSGGMVSNSMLSSRLGVRFVIAPKTPPGEIFGVGNGMLPFGGSWFSGYMLADYVEARELGVVCSRGPDNDDTCYLTAVAGIPIHSTSVSVDQGVPEGSDFGNPADPAYIDVYNPKGLAFFTQKAEAIGRNFGANPMIASCQMANEKQYMHGGSLCPSKSADAHFREWCKRRHGDLKTLNERWGSKYTSWDQIEQIVSARFVEEEKNRPKLQGAAAIDWTAAARSLGEPVLKRMAAEPGRGMDWLRWRTETTLWMYSTFREHAKKFDGKTLYSTNLAWPNFWPQMYMPFIRAMDVTMADFQYTSGFPKALGTPQEMIDIAEMSESVGRDKPFWGIEVYVQPSWPGAYAGLQNWAMVAHGVSNNLVFAWKPYSDAGPVQTSRAWEKPDAPPMWFIIDADGTKLPGYYSNKRSAREIADYHRQYNAHSIKRVQTPIAMYISPDTAEYVVFETGNKPWVSCWTRTKSNLVYVLRMNGITADYVDDVTLPERPGKFSKLIVPATYVLNQDAARKIASFAKEGGTVVLAGVSGVRDPWLRAYENLGGPAWSDLAWRAPEFKANYAKVVFGKDVVLGIAAETAGTVGGKVDTEVGEGKTFRGVNIGTMAGAEPIKDEQGEVVGWSRAWGKGRLIAYGVFPDTYVSNPHPSVNMTYWIRKVIDQAGLEFTGRWVAKAKPSTLGHLGTGDPVVEVVVREKSSTEKFVFCLNQGGGGEGVVEIPLGTGMWTGRDVITGKPVVGEVKERVWRLVMRLEPWGYRVIRLSRGGELAK